MTKALNPSHYMFLFLFKDANEGIQQPNTNLLPPNVKDHLDRWMNLSAPIMDRIQLPKINTLPSLLYQLELFQRI